MTTKRQQEIVEFIGKGCKTDEYGLYIFGTDENNKNHQMIAETRGWGAIQHLFENENEATTFQDDLSKFIARAIDEKVKKVLSKKTKKEEKLEYREELKKLQEDFLNAALGPSCTTPENKRKANKLKSQIKRLKRRYQ